MTEQKPIIMAIAGADDLARVERKLDAVMAMLQSSNIRPKSEWMSVSEYAAHIKRSERTVREWAKSGKIESRRSGHVLEIHR